jgi:fructose transport system ATP-binding protein
VAVTPPLTSLAAAWIFVPFPDEHGENERSQALKVPTNPAEIDALAVALAHPDTVPASVVELRNIHKRYGHVVALQGASFAVYPGTINAIVGDNGAGKSTLIKVLAGAIQPDDGQVIFEGQPTILSDPADARSRGIETVYQDLALATFLDPAANVFLGREIVRDGSLGRWFGFLDFKKMERETDERLQRLKIDLGPARKSVEALSGGQRQAVAIARAVSWSQKVLVLDEPTAALGVKESGVVLDLIRQVRDAGIAIVLIMHNIPLLFEISDRLTVMRLGRDVGHFLTSQTTMQEVIHLMTGLTSTDRSESQP